MSSRCRGQFSQMGSQRLLLLFRKDAHSRIITRPACTHARHHIRPPETRIRKAGFAVWRGTSACLSHAAPSEALQAVLLVMPDAPRVVQQAPHRPATDLDRDVTSPMCYERGVV